MGQVSVTGADDADGADANGLCFGRAYEAIAPTNKRSPGPNFPRCCDATRLVQARAVGQPERQIEDRRTISRV
jgi:hypothetical protein